MRGTVAKRLRREAYESASFGAVKEEYRALKAEYKRRAITPIRVRGGSFGSRNPVNTIKSLKKYRGKP